MGTWPIYKKTTLPTTDLNKKLSFDKISPHDFYFFPFFSICTCMKLESALYCVHGSSVVSICVKSQNQGSSALWLEIGVSATYWTMTDLVPAGLFVINTDR